MLKHTTVLYLVICALMFIIFIQRCSNTNTKECKVELKEGSFVDTKPVLLDSISKLQMKDEVATIIKNVEIEQLEKIKDFETKTDVEKTNILKESVKTNVYKNKKEDDNIIIEYTAITSGTLEYINFDYTTKEKIVKDKPKNHIYLGGSVNMNMYDNKHALNATVGFQNKKGDILHFSYGTDKSITVGYMFKLF